MSTSPGMMLGAVLAAWVALLPAAQAGWDVDECAAAEATLVTPPDSSVAGMFGVATVLHGDILLVGAPLAAVNDIDSGAVLIFRLQSGRWAHAGALVPADADAGQQFGSSLALDAAAGRLVVGSASDDDVAKDRGSAYVYVADGAGGWIEQSKLVPEDAKANSGFGWSADIDDDTIVIGAPFEDNVIGALVGNAYVFTMDGRGRWTQQAKLFPDVAPNGAIFGAAVAVDGDRALVGAPYLGMEFIVGAAHAFTRSGTSWQHVQHIVSPISLARDRFGTSLDLDGDLAIIGAPRDAPPTYGTLSVFLYSARIGQWESVYYAAAPDMTVLDRFGQSMRLQDDFVLVGAPVHAGVGAIYRYDRVGPAVTFACKLMLPEAAEGDYFGTALAVDGDRFAAAALMDDELGTDSGSVLVADFGLSNPADLSGDGVVNGVDLALLLGAWGACPTRPGTCPADLDGNGVVNGIDLAIVLASWG